MITAEKSHAIFLTMPVVEEESRVGHIRFRLRGKLFGTLWSGAGFATLKVGYDEQTMLATSPKVFSIPANGGKGGWIMVKLATISEDEFPELVWKAWRNVAPPRLGLQY